ncbi:malate dehydrogenase (oxaloacetate-decarboxylating) [Fervidobacterium changbaicum]|uniref:NADP-dependent malic enzyme n=1 Tax=Fervidobacterium changbaicum TaxID=310769 RepID=A0AAE5XCD7_9BACT|nr:NADP-dependent malic enzyme [Fervidobacterium changbaicum]QAV32303.1 NADP-dependent malic enzyme [Fervidobacterium changbaicum]QAV34067.1 NADP-dependent malic enzyme [Fervidobacterium changbaicum]SDH23155.1 malate dehydrogenase (oxaloacetate-decarboxylating) [Fervidobacterium changbaicum]
MGPLDIHRLLQGKYKITVPLEVTEENLKYLYTPGVAEVAMECAREPSNAFIYTRRKRVIAVVSDGSAVLGLGNIGPYGALPVMEGKAMLFKEFGNLDAFPICLGTQNTEEIISIVKALEPSFGGINLEDISAPRCFEILKHLDSETSIPVFHDDQQGTAVVVLAGLQNALKLAGKRISDVKIVVNGIGAAGYNITKLLLEYGAKNVYPCDVYGLLNESTALHEYHLEISRLTNPKNISATLKECLKDADVFIGVSKGNLLTGEDIKQMAKNPVIFALANPTPEIMPDTAYENGAFIVATGRSDFPNQVNNLLAFPGIMRAAVEKQRKITHTILLKAAEIISKTVEPSRYMILPKATDRRLHEMLYKGLIEIFD